MNKFTIGYVFLLYFLSNSHSSDMIIKQNLEIPFSISKNKYPENVPYILITETKIFVNNKFVTNVKNLSKISQNNTEPIIPKLNRCLSKLYRNEQIQFKNGLIKKQGQILIYNHKENSFDILYMILKTCWKAGYCRPFLMTSQQDGNHISCIALKQFEPGKNLQKDSNQLFLTIIISEAAIQIGYKNDLRSDTISEKQLNISDRINPTIPIKEQLIELKKVLLKIKNESPYFKKSKDIIIAANGNIKYHHIISVIDQCRSIGLSKIKIARIQYIRKKDTKHSQNSFLSN